MRAARGAWWAVAALAAALVTAGCPGQAPRADAPPEFRYGADPCDRCGMIVSEERYAAATVTSSGTARRFDDLGCLTAFQAERGEAPAAVWVHDHDTRAWERGRAMWYARTKTLVTPMGTGIVAVRDEARARALAAQAGGDVLSAEAFLALGAGAFPR